MTSTIQMNYKPTVIQKLLGKNYKWWYLMKYNFVARTTYRVDQLFFVLGSVVTLVGTLIIWWIAGGKVFDANFQEKLTYFLVGELFYYTIFNFAGFFGVDIKRGAIAKDLLKPSNYMTYTFVCSIGTAGVQKIVNISVLGSALIFFSSYLLHPGLLNIILTILLVPISMAIFYFLEILVAFSAFWTTEINGIMLNYTFLSRLLSGKLFPLGLLLSSFSLHIFNPFAFTFYHPMQIYLGKYSPLETFYVFAAGITWCITLYFLAKWVFKAGLKRNEAIGL